MPLITAVSFSNDSIQIVTARRNKSGTHIRATHQIAPSELDQFLSQDRSDHYLLLVNSPDASYETIQIPPVEPRLVSTLVQAELRRKYPDLSLTSFAFQVIGDQTIDGKTIRKVVCCLLKEDTAAALLETFIRHNKPVHQLLSTPMILGQLVRQDLGVKDQTQLCTHDSGTVKTIFLYEQGAVTFVRYVPSEGTGWQETDLQNIAMTLDYCFQTLRTRPTGTLALNSPDAPPPLIRFDASDILPGTPELITSFLAPLILLNLPISPAMNLLPATYQGELKQQKLLRNGAAFFAFLLSSTLVSLIYLLIQTKSLSEQFRAEKVPDSELFSALGSYRAVQKERAEQAPLFSAIETLQSGPALAALFSSLPASPSGTMLQVHQAAIQKNQTNIALHLTGIIKEQTLATAQLQLENYAKQVVRAHQGLTLVEQKLEPATRAFSVNLEFKQ